MNAVNAVQLFILVWTFTAVCQADDDISVICEDVTGTVRNEVTLTCSVSLKCTKLCVTLYKFYYPEKYNDSTICKQEFPHDSCDQRNRFTCSFTPTTVMTEQFRFFVQTQCGWKDTEFTVTITEPKKGSRTGDNPGSEEGSVSEDTAITAVTGCFFIILIIITLTIISKKKPNDIKPSGFQRRMFLCLRHDDDNSNCLENVM